jgi:hypothetical protein
VTMRALRFICRCPAEDDHDGSALRAPEEREGGDRGGILEVRRAATEELLVKGRKNIEIPGPDVLLHRVHRAEEKGTK